MENRSPLLKKLKLWFNKLIGKHQWVGEWQFQHIAADGSIKDSWCMFNALADEGENNLLDEYFRNQNAPSNFFIRLYNDTPVETDTLADLTGEPSTNGYSSQSIGRDTSGWPTLALNSGDFRLTSEVRTFSASGGSWGPVTYAVLATVGTGTSGKLLAYVALSTSRTLADGESLQVTLNIKLQ